MFSFSHPHQLVLMINTPPASPRPLSYIYDCGYKKYNILQTISETLLWKELNKINGNYMPTPTRICCS